jgi:hypothetical protein
VKNLTLNNAAGYDLQGLLKNVQVLRDGKPVSKYVALEGRDMVIAFDNETIDGGRTVTYTIEGTIDVLERVPTNVQLQLKKTADLIAEETSTKFRTTVNDNQIDFTSYSILGGKIRLVNDDSFSNSVDAGLNSSAVVVAKGTLEVAEPTLLKNLQIKPTAGSGIIKNLAIEVGGSRYGLDYSSTNDLWSIDEIAVSKNSTIRILVDLMSTGSDAFVVIGNITASSFHSSGEFLNNAERFAPATAIAGVIKGSTLNIKTPTFSLTETSNLSTQKVVAGDANTRVVFEGDLVSKKGDVTGRSIVISGTSNSLNANTKLSLNVYIDGQAYNCGTEVVGSNFTTCKVTQGLGTINTTAKKIKVETYLDATQAGAAGNISFDIYADGKLDGNDTQSNTASTIQLSVSSSASITVSNAGSANTIALAGSNKTLAKFDVNVTNGYVNLTGLTLTGSFTGTQYRLYIDGDDTVANYEINTGLTGVNFTGFNFYAKEGKHTVEIKANIPNDVQNGVKVNVNSYDIVGSAIKSGSLSLQYYFVRVIPTISIKSRNTDTNELILNVFNGYDTTFEITGLSGTNVAGASVGGNKVTIVNGTPSQGSTALSSVTVAKGDTVEIKLNVDAGKTLTLDGLTYKVDEDGGPYIYNIDDTYADPIKWGDFRISGK